MEDPFFKELCVLMRKYQNTFEFFKLNNKTIIDTVTKHGVILEFEMFRESNDIFKKHNNKNEEELKTIAEQRDKEIRKFFKTVISRRLNLANEEKNVFEFKLHITPKCCIEDLPFEIKDQNLQLLITTTSFINKKNLNLELNENLTSLKILNQANFNLDPERKKNKKLYDFFKLKINDHIKQQDNNIITGINKFLNYIENFFPEILKQNSFFAMEKSDAWSQREQDLLEKALVKYKDSPNTGEKFIKIGLYVGSKTGKQCLMRFKEISVKLKHQMEKEEEKRRVIEELKKKGVKESKDDGVSDDEGEFYDINKVEGYSDEDEEKTRGKKEEEDKGEDKVEDKGNEADEGNNDNKANKGKMIKEIKNMLSKVDKNDEKKANEILLAQKESKKEVKNKGLLNKEIFKSDFIPEEINPEKDSLVSLVDEIVLEFSVFKAKILEERLRLNKMPSNLTLSKINSRYSEYSGNYYVNDRLVNINEEEFDKEYDNDNNIDEEEKEDYIIQQKYKTNFPMNNKETNLFDELDNIEFIEDENVNENIEYKDVNNNDNKKQNKEEKLMNKIKLTREIVNPMDKEIIEKLEEYIPQKDKDGKYIKNQAFYANSIHAPHKYFFNTSKTAVKKSENSKFSSNVEIKHLESILLLSDKYSLWTDYTHFKQTLVMQISSDFQINAMCKRCKKTSFSCQFTKLQDSSPVSIYYFGTYCVNCLINMYIIVIPKLIHKEGRKLYANVFALNCEPTDYIPSSFEFTCTHCISSDNEVTLRFSKVHVNRFTACVCYNCHGKFEIMLEPLRFYTNDSILATEFLSYIEKYKKSPLFSNFTKELSTTKNIYRRIFTLPQGGGKLPNDGSCSHYKHQFRWYKFSCCYRYYPCYLCHQEQDQTHYPNIESLVCGFCSAEQSDEIMKCGKCANMLQRDKAGVYWEGGKGQISKSKMSAKDSHKYTGNNKTMSRKKQDKIRKNNN